MARPHFKTRRFASGTNLVVQLLLGSIAAECSSHVCMHWRHWAPCLDTPHGFGRLRAHRCKGEASSSPYRVTCSEWLNG